MDQCKFSDENDCRKISSKIEARNSSGSLVRSGNVTAISKRCMCVNTNHRFPENSTIRLQSHKKNILELSVRVLISQYINCNYKMSIEVLNPSLDYIALANNH
jgi:hypothetical protein